MTLNIVLHCRDGIVLACDSLASQIQTVLIPESGEPLIDPDTGNPMLNPYTNKPIVDAKSLKSRETIVNIFGNVNKLFQIRDYPVGVVISGLGQIGDELFDDLFDEFSHSMPEEKQNTNYTIENIAKKLHEFLKDKYTKAFPSLEKDSPGGGPPLFLMIAGYSKDKRKGEIYDLSFPKNELRRLNDPKKPYVLSVGGQSDAIERFLTGMNQHYIDLIVSQISSQWHDAVIKIHRETIRDTIASLEKNRIKITNKAKEAIPKLKKLKIPIQIKLPDLYYHIELENMSLQDSVDFVMFLTTITYGRQRFVSGIPTVGGKVNIATITRKDGFMLHTPQEIKVTAVNI